MDTTKIPKLLVSKREAATALGVSVRTIDNLLACKELRGRKVGRGSARQQSAQGCPSKCDLGRAEKPAAAGKFNSAGYSPALASANDARVRLPAV